MFVKVKNKIEPRKVRHWAFELSFAFGSTYFGTENDKRPSLSIITEYQQDGESLFPKENETFIKVDLWQRYYTKGYERGPLPFFIMVAEWLEQKIPDSQVWYGGDSSGKTAKLFNKKKRDKLFKHFVEVGHFPYYDTPVCDICNENMIQENNINGWRCPKCDFIFYKEIESSI